MTHYWRSERGLAELKEVSDRFPSLSLIKDVKRHRMVLTGIIQVAPGAHYTLDLVFPPNYPKEVPTLFCNRDEIPWEADRHVFQDTGAACLCARSEYRIHWPYGSTLLAFFERLVLPFFVGQFFYQTHGTWPSTGYRSHGASGILEAYAELASPLGSTSKETIERLMILLSRKNNPKGHEICPCGSGRIMRKCHGHVVRSLRTQIQPGHAAADYVCFLRQRRS